MKLPGWWMLILSEMESEILSNQEDQSQYLLLLKNFQKSLNLWSRKSKKWEISSSSMLLEKISKLPGDICQTSYSIRVKEIFENLFESYLNTEEPDETECLDFQSKKITSMSSTIAPLQDDIAGTSGGTKLNLLDSLGQLVKRTNQYGSLRETTGTMSSTISFLENGELVKYGLEEKIGKNRLTV